MREGKWAPSFCQQQPHFPQVGFGYLHPQVKELEFQNPVSYAYLNSLWNHPVNKLEQELSGPWDSWPTTPLESLHLYMGPEWKEGTPDLLATITRARGWEMLVSVWGFRMGHPKMCLSGMQIILS